MNKHFTQLEFDKILQMLADCAVSQSAKEQALALSPYLKEAEALRRMEETSQAKAIVEAGGSPPLAAMRDLDEILELAAKGAMLVPEQLNEVSTFLTTCRRLKAYLKRSEQLHPVLASYGGAIDELSELSAELDRSLRDGAVDESASPALRDFRRQAENKTEQIKGKLSSLLRANKDWFADGYVAMRDGHYTLPVKKEHKNKVVGSVIGASQSGGTFFIEPSAVGKLQDELSLLHIAEDNEVRRILYTLTGLVEAYTRELSINIEAMETLDFAFAKAKLSLQMKAGAAKITTDRRIIIKSGRHPLLKAETAVPLDIELGISAACIVITGPNTGGKTVALKTVGLLSLMAQSGLHIPAGDGSSLCMHNAVLCDIGDGQSITANLSTFSSHMTAVIDILRAVDRQSLVLLDELGSGTDPAEGMGLATAILEELAARGCLLVATTHYPEIKEFATHTDGFVNARMAFDRATLQPLYRLEVGEAGESCALYIAKRLGLPSSLLERAYCAAYGGASDEFAGNAELARQSADRIVEKQQHKVVQARAQTFNRGDSVMVYPQQQIGIVYATANDRGEIGVQVKEQKKILVNHKRLKLLAPANEMYPPDYDFSVIFDTVANRKASRILGKRHDPNVSITREADDVK